MARSGNPVSDLSSPGDYQCKTVEVRKAENGYIRRESLSDSKGYSSKETIHKGDPGLGGSGRESAPAEHRAGSEAMKAAKAILGKK